MTKWIMGNDYIPEEAPYNGNKYAWATEEEAWRGCLKELEQLCDHYNKLYDEVHTKFMATSLWRRGKSDDKA